MSSMSVAGAPSVSKPRRAVGCAEPGAVWWELVAWSDPVVARFGHDPRSAYVERFWLPVLGPSVIVAARRCAVLFDGSGSTVAVDPVGFSAGLGLVPGSVSKTLNRLVLFGLALTPEPGRWELRTSWPDVSARALAQRDPSGALRNELRAWERSVVHRDESERVERQWWRKVIGAHTFGAEVSKVDAELRAGGCEDRLRVELVNWMRWTPLHGSATRQSTAPAPTANGAGNGAGNSTANGTANGQSNSAGLESGMESGNG